MLEETFCDAPLEKIAIGRNLCRYLFMSICNFSKYLRSVRVKKIFVALQMVSKRMIYSFRYFIPDVFVIAGLRTKCSNLQQPRDRMT